MSRRYAASERVRTWSDDYRCTVSVIPDRELVYHYDPLPVPQSPAERVEFIKCYLRKEGEATIPDICNALGLTRSIVRLTLLAHTDIFQARKGKGRQWQVNLWSLKESPGHD